MGNVSVKVRLRPVRFAFMVRPEDRANLLKAFHINTCLWGGLYNPIIPFFKRVPAWWERHGIKFENATQIVNGYLDYFEPDFVVEVENGIARSFGIDPERILHLPDILPRDDRREERGQGQSVIDLYRKLYKEEFQFVRRHKNRIVDVKAAAPYDAFAACLFGAFPKAQNLKYFATAFKEAFDPKQVTLDAVTLEKLYKSPSTSALQIGYHGLDVAYNDHTSPTLFVLDAQAPNDLLDFWNYRATHRSVVAVPAQWLPQLSESGKKFIIRNYRPRPGNPNRVMIEPICLFSRSIPENDINELHAKYLMVDEPGANTRQVWYPPIWRPPPQFMVRRTRPTITAAATNFDVQTDIEKPVVRFEPLYPDFAARFAGDNRWANVVRLAEWGGTDRLATVFPTDFRVQAIPKYGAGGDFLVSTNEGLVHFPEFKDIPQHWHLVEGKDAIELWLKEKNIACRLSESGRATEQIIHTLGGFLGVRCLSHKGIIDLLAEMARSPISRSAPHDKFRQKIQKAVGKDIWRRDAFETLVERKVVELGQELKCSKCGSWGWHALHELDAVMNCDLCLKQFDFPLTMPTDSKRAKWAYRVIGPFALPNYANGGYAAALAIRFFADVIGGFHRSEITWSPGKELTFPNGEKVEADFLLWCQRKPMSGIDHATEIVFGEAKSFGKDVFKDEDIKRLKILAEQYSGAVLVFAALKEASEFSKDEIKRIRKLAEWGREYNKEKRETRAPVIVLTGTELFTPHHLEEVWKQKGGMHKQLAGPGYTQLERLKTLADFTQQLYLDMPSYAAWRDAKGKKRKC